MFPLNGEASTFEPMTAARKEAATIKMAQSGAIRKSHRIHAGPVTMFLWKSLGYLVFLAIFWAIFYVLPVLK